MKRASLRKIYWSVLNLLPRKAALKLNLALRCLCEDWDFAVNVYLFSADFAALEEEEVRKRLEGLDENSIAVAVEYVRRCRNLERMKGFPFSDGSCALIRQSALEKDIMCVPPPPPELKACQKKYGFKTGAEVLIYQHGLSFYRKLISEYARGKVFIDAGACIGELIPALLEYAPEKIYAFEPSAKNVRRFEKEMKKRTITSDKVVIVPAGLGEQAGSMSFDDCGGSGQQISGNEKGSSKCPVTTLDIFAEEKNISSVGLIKTDVEGMGLSLLHGAVKVIQRDRPVLALAAYHNTDELLGQYEFLKSNLPDYHFEIRDLPPGSSFEVTLLGLPREIMR